MKKLEEVIFYTIEKAIKSYRQYAQKQIYKAGFELTIDQWLILKCLSDEPDIHLQDLAKKVFKDNASVTRIIEKLIEKKYLKKFEHLNDGRRSKFVLSKLGINAIDAVHKIVIQNRKHALREIQENKVKYIQEVLEKIATNCIK